MDLLVRPLRIALLAGCLEPGRDGVGDYTHGLAVEALAAGAKVVTIALADRFVSEVRHVEREDVPVLRLPGDMTWPERMTRLRITLDEFDPDWISLQFVPYSFHPRGWVQGLAERLRPLLKSPPDQHGKSKTRSLHLMFHELWLGAQPGAPWKHRIEGLWQRWLILRSTRVMRPAQVHTSNPAYAQTLKAYGVEASVLPLFGSIPVIGQEEISAAAENWFAGEMRTLGIRDRERAGWWLFGVFGSIHQEWWPGELFRALREQKATHVRRIGLLTLGRTGAAGENVMARLGREFAGQVAFHHLGEQPPERVAAVFRGLDFGISTSPWALIGKSSSTAAMREHGLPVIVTRVGVDQTGGGSDPAMGDSRLLRFNSELAGRLEVIGRGEPESRRPALTRRWLADLLNTSATYTDDSGVLSSPSCSQHSC